jgi:hypothetical protein
MASMLRRSRIQRSFVSLSDVAVILTGLLFAWLLKGSNVLYIAMPAIVIALIVVAKSWSQYQNRTYDPTWALRFQAVFDGMGARRKKAADCLLRRHDGDSSSNDGPNSESLVDVDDVLDFFEDIGFYVSGGQISAEVAHHHFYHWIRGYWKASRDYIGARRQLEPGIWSHVGKLFDTTWDIESSQTNRSKEQELAGDSMTFLNDESSCE